MANRTNHLTHFHLVRLFNCGRGADRSTNQDALDALHGVANCLSAFPSWAEVTSSSQGDIMSIRFVRGKTGRELSQSFHVLGRRDASEWLEFEGYSIETKGWRHGS